MFRYYRLTSDNGTVADYSTENMTMGVSMMLQVEISRGNVTKITKEKYEESK